MGIFTQAEWVRIAFIGGGNMATSLLKGLLAEGYSPHHLVVSDPDPAKRLALGVLGIRVEVDNPSAIAGAQLIILAVKPKQMKTVVQQLALSLSDVDVLPLVVSVAAGIRISALTQWLGYKCPMIRAMPNTPTLINQGVTGLYANPAASVADRALAESIFKAVGTVVWVIQESQMDAVTALSGSGPAYLFLFLELLEKQAVALGLTPEVGRQLILPMAVGAANMAVSSDHDLASLRQQVTSPGGTTEKAIAAFLEQGALAHLIAQAVQAAHQRAIELGNELGC